MVEKADKSGYNEVKIPVREDSSSLEAVIDYIYTKNPPTNTKAWPGVYRAALKYKVAAIQTWIAEQVVYQPKDLDLITELSNAAWELEDKMLKQAILPLVKENFDELQKHPVFCTLITKYVPDFTLWIVQGLK